MVHGLRLCLPMKRTPVESLVGELRSHLPQGQKKQNIKQKQYCNKLNKGLKLVHIKKKKKLKKKRKKLVVKTFPQRKFQIQMSSLGNSLPLRIT